MVHYRQSKLYTAGTCICLRFRRFVTARWQMRPQAIIVRSRHSSLHLNLSSLLLTSPEEAKKSLLSSLLLVSVVNHHHLLVGALTSFYSHTKDTFCHLWLLQCTVRGPFSIPWRWGTRGSNGSQETSWLLSDVFNATLKMCAKACPSSAKCTLLHAVSYTVHFTDWHKSTPPCTQHVWLV